MLKTSPVIVAVLLVLAWDRLPYEKAGCPNFVCQEGMKLVMREYLLPLFGTVTAVNSLSVTFLQFNCAWSQ